VLAWIDCQNNASRSTAGGGAVTGVATGGVAIGAAAGAAVLGGAAAGTAAAGAAAAGAAASRHAQRNAPHRHRSCTEPPRIGKICGRAGAIAETGAHNRPAER
jgi:hypothetical protein